MASMRTCTTCNQKYEVRDAFMKTPGDGRGSNSLRPKMGWEGNALSRMRLRAWLPHPSLGAMNCCPIRIRIRMVEVRISYTVMQRGCAEADPYRSFTRCRVPTFRYGSASAHPLSPLQRTNTPSQTQQFFSLYLWTAMNCCSYR